MPVLSISSTSTSPAASTARPEVAITLACIMRLMPATPIAESKAPIVVGIRQTSSATSVVTVTAVPALATSTLKIDIGNSVTTTTRKTIVKATSRMLRAISFGVFCRRAPSTIEIMRSRNDSPALTVMRTTSQSERTRVPPVTDAKSPPASRMTGADSPVIALSSTEATPSMTSPSSGIGSPASTYTTAPFFSSSASCGCQAAPRLGSCSTLAMTRFFMPRRLAVCALLRPSASASAKLANSTVNQSQTATWRMKEAGASPLPPSAWKPSTVVRMLPT